MKQKNFRNFILAAALASAALTACKPENAAPASEGEAVVLGPQYSAKKGLLLPEDTRLSLGVRVAEVKEQQVSATLDFPLSVYQVGESGLASAAVTPEQAKLLKAGQTVEMKTVDGHTFAGKVRRLNDELQKATGTIEALVEFRPVPGAVKAGAFFQGRVTLDTATNVVSIPHAALLQCSDGYSVYTVSGEHLVRTPVKIGAANADFVEITDGLYSGDQVVLQPVMSLWMTELAAVKGGQACCVAPPKGK
jgi:hypothetical protein